MKEYRDGLRILLYQATDQPLVRKHGKILCPYRKCMNEKYWKIDIVKRHLYNKGFKPNYYVWLSHGKCYSVDA